MVEIVTVNVSQTIAPAPSTLQRTGAIVSQGATTTAANTLTLLTQTSDLTPILKGALAISTLAYATGTVTATTAAPHGFTISETVEIFISGATPVGYNGTFLCTVTGTSTFTYAHSSLVTNTLPGVYTVEDVSELVSQVTTFFAQGNAVSVYIFETGAANPTDAVGVVSIWIANNPKTVYSWLVPRFWDANAAFLTLIASFEAPGAETYFFVTTTVANFSTYTPLMKCVLAHIEAPIRNSSLEFTAASDFRVTLNYRPSPTNKVTPLIYSYLFGVTAYPTAGNAALFATLKAAGVNIVGTGSEGGITNTLLLWGTTMDVRPFNYWYSVDWASINLKLNLANYIINGSNNPVNPLYLNQDGINRLQGVAARTMNSAITYGLALGRIVLTSFNAVDFGIALENGDFAGQVVINAVPFQDYYTANPSDYPIGEYDGLSVTYTPLQGFEHIIVNLNVTDFVTA